MMLSDEEKQQIGLTQLLPASLGEALEELEKNRTWVDGVLGADYVKWFMILKKAEMTQMSDMDQDQRKLLLIRQL